MYSPQRDSNVRVKTRYEEENDNEVHTINNYYINSPEKKPKPYAKRPKEPIYKSDLDKFIETKTPQNYNTELTVEEKFEEKPKQEHYQNYSPDINYSMSHSYLPEIERLESKSAPIKPIILAVVSGLMGFMTVFNIFQMRNYELNIETNNQTLTAKELQLDALGRKIQQMQDLEIEEKLTNEGYVKIEESTLKELVPNEKNVPVTYDEQTNWFDVICNSLYNFFSKD